MSVNLDPELTELFAADPELTELAGLLATATAPRVQPNPAFQRGLRDRLVREGWRRQTSPAQPWFRRLFFTSTSLNWSAGIAGILLIVFGLLIFNTRQGFSPVEVSSPLADAHQVAVVKPIQLSFTQPMNKPATEAAISLKPATRVSYHWTSPSKVEITPQAGSLTPGTKYQVTVAPTARTAAGTVLPKPSQLHFVTAEPAPPAAPPASDDGLSPTLAGIHSLGSTGGARSAWSSDGRHLYVIDPAGQLLAYSAAGGAAQVIASSGVSQVAAGPEGIAYVQGNDLVYGNQALQGVSPQAIGWQNSSPIYL
ncbi:MAG: Ig-like domain-containing protein, partial [Candidatus Dormibacteraceae bacterium]